MPRAQGPTEGASLKCEDGCGCLFERRDAFVLSIDGEAHFFCCADCADAYQGTLKTPTLDILRKHIRPGETVADLGCGSGHYTFLLSDLVGPQGTVIAVDPDPALVRQLEEGLKKKPSASNIRVHVSPAERLRDIRTGSVDFVLSNNVLCCTDLRKEAVDELVRILRPGGTAYLRASKILTKGSQPISEPEWNSLLHPFVILDRGTDASARWALLRRRERP
jgi:SAM-dependent methyltransferase